MTVIAYRNGVMASDSLVNADHVNVGTVKKVTKKAGWLAGGAGNLRDIALFLEIFEESIEEAGEEFIISPEAKFENLGGIIVSPEGKVWHIEASGYPYQVEDDFHVNGIGYEIAIGAFEMGATAEQAVEVAIKRSANCGGPVQVVRLAN